MTVSKNVLGYTIMISANEGPNGPRFRGEVLDIEEIVESHGDTVKQVEDDLYFKIADYNRDKSRFISWTVEEDWDE